MTKYERITKKSIEKMAIYIYDVSTAICDKFDCTSCPFRCAPCYNKTEFISWVKKEIEK